MSEEVLSTSTDDSLIKSEYDKVIFYDVADWYSTDADVQCKYTLTPGIHPSHGDRVALFKVGWTAPHQYLKYEWAPIPEQGSVPTEVLFQMKDLPKDDGEFYQFCYISSEGSVRGASIPFQFRRPHVEDLMEVEDDDNDLLIIRSRTAVMEEKMREVAVKNVELLKGKSKADKELEEEKQKNEDKNLRIKFLEGELERELELKKQTEVQHLASIIGLENKIRTATEQKEELTCKIVTQNKEKERLLKEIANMESRLKLSAQQIELMSKEQTSVTKNLHHQVEALESSLQEERQKIKDLQAINRELEEGRERLLHQLLDTEHMLAAMEKSKYLATEEIMAHTEFKEKVTRDLEITRCDVHNLKCQLKNLQDENKKQLQENVKLQEDFSELEKKYSSLKVKFDELTKKESNWQKEELALKSAVDDLKERLKAGATEYHSKYIESLKLERKVTKLKKKLQEKMRSDVKSVAEIKVGEKEEAVAEDLQSEDKTKVQDQHVSSSTELAEKDQIINSLKQEMKQMKASALPAKQQEIPRYPDPCYYHPPYAVYRCATNPFQYEKRNPAELPVSPNESPLSSDDDILDKPASNGLPPPILPEVTTKAKLVAIAAMNRQITNQVEASREEEQLSNYATQNAARNIYIPEEQVNTASAEHEPIPKICPICDLTFMGTDVDQMFQDHVEAHYGFDCPVCNAHYNPDQTAQLELHVQTHFSNDSPSGWKYQVNID